MYKRYENEVKERDNLQRELQRLKDNAKLRQDAAQSLGASAAGGSAEKSKSGFQLWQILIIAVLFMIIGGMLGKH